MCPSATMGPYAQIAPKLTQPAPNSAACPPTASNPPGYLWHANCAFCGVVCARFGYILHDTTCCHDSSSRLHITSRAEPAPSHIGRPAEPPSTCIAPGSPTEATIVASNDLAAHILHAQRSYSAILNTATHTRALRAAAATANAIYTACRWTCAAGYYELLCVCIAACLRH